MRVYFQYTSYYIIDNDTRFIYNNFGSTAIQQ